jgi:hypothetical protein
MLTPVGVRSRSFDMRGNGRMGHPKMQTIFDGLSDFHASGGPPGARAYLKQLHSRRRRKSSA